MSFYKVINKGNITAKVFDNTSVFVAAAVKLRLYRCADGSGAVEGC